MPADVFEPVRIGGRNVDGVLAEADDPLVGGEADSAREQTRPVHSS